MRNSTAYEKSQIPKYSYSEPFIFFTLKDILVILLFINILSRPKLFQANA